jgi:deoxyribose-phosphate aldolase
MAGIASGIKPAGGISKAQDAYRWWVMVREVFGEEGTKPTRFRIGASSLLGNVVEALEESLRG